MYSAFSDVFLVHKKSPADDMSKQSSLLHLWGKKKEPPDHEDEDQRPVRPSSSDPSPSTSAGKKDRKFQQVWLEKYHWLQFQKDRMFCDTYILVKASSNPFTECCLNFQNSTLTRHEQSKAHLSSVQVLNLRSNFRAAQKSAVDLSESDKVVKLSEFTMQLRTVYTMIKRDIPAL